MKKIVLVLSVFIFLLAPIIGKAQILNIGTVTPSSDPKFYNSIINATKALEYMNGYVIKAGQVFSFNNVVGRRTTERGFVIGLSGSSLGYYKDLGGGVCEASTAAYRAAASLGLQIIERHHHNGPVVYAPNGDDAAVDWPYWDLKFRNTLNYDLTIKSYKDNNGNLIVDLCKEDYPDRNYNVTVCVNGEQMTFDDSTKPFISQNRVFVPYRILAEKLGAKVDWDGATNTVTTTLNNISVKFTIESNTFTVNNQSYTSDVDPFISDDGTTYVPARFLLTGLNVNLNFDSTKGQLLIND